MAKIKKITFSHVSKMDGCTCDRCGQYIQNVWTITYHDGTVLHFGIDCFEKLCKESRLNAYGMKLMKKGLKSIQHYTECLESWQNGEFTEECLEWQTLQADWNDNYWKGRNFDEYKKWMIEEFFPNRIEHKQRDLERKFKSVNFKKGE